jgi:hypothetical protein
MTLFKFGSSSPRRWLVLAGFMFLAIIAPAAHGQGRGFRPRPFMMNSTTPSMMRSRTPTMTSTQTNALLRRDLRFDSRLQRDFRFDRFERELGLSQFAGMPFGGFLGGGFSGIAAIPVGGGGGTTTPVAQNSSADTTDTARAALLLEQAVAERLANRRRAFDELLYEREKTPNPEHELLSRSRANPPQAEVLSGQALNSLLTDLRQFGTGSDDVNRPDALLPLDRTTLRHINVAHGSGNIAVLKDHGKVTWPAAFAAEAYQEPRDRLTARAMETVRAAERDSRVDPAAVRQMAADADQLRKLLRENKALSFPAFIEARDFLQRFDDALVVLRQPDAADYFNGTYELKAQTVLGLVKQMTDAGLRFAPAAPGDEAAYSALRDALAACDRATAKPQSAAR